MQERQRWCVSDLMYLAVFLAPLPTPITAGKHKHSIIAWFDLWASFLLHSQSMQVLLPLDLLETLHCKHKPWPLSIEKKTCFHLFHNKGGTILGRLGPLQAIIGPRPIVRVDGYFSL